MLFDELVFSHKGGTQRGITAVCSTHPWVLQAALRVDGSILIESTCNQVNQYGGYTGLTPAQFAQYLYRLAAEAGYPVEKILLGGDHIGPSAWSGEAAEIAMRKAEGLAQACMAAGYQKLHLDASMHLGGDDTAHPLDVELAAQRAARLAFVAEQAYPAAGGRPPCYVIGTEVPPPGGVSQHEQRVSVTTVEGVRQTIDATQRAFVKTGLEPAWERVMAVVVQPGVEFGDNFVLDYSPVEARELVRFVERTPFVYEAHSTDYQTRRNLRALVRDHFAILKVGPALTFAFREAVFALAAIEAEMFPAEERSSVVQTIEAAMLDRPGYWQKYYPGTPVEQAFKRKYSLSDRIRYYWPQPVVQSALQRLVYNLERKSIPWALLSQYAPDHYRRIRQGKLAGAPRAMVMDRISAVLDDYSAALE